MKNPRFWLFVLLVVIGAALMLVSWNMPWWVCNVAALGSDVVVIHPWGLSLDPVLGGFEILIKGAQMPEWFAPMMWAYLGLCMLVLLVGVFIPDREIGLGKFKFTLPKLLIGGVGLSYLIVPVVMAIYGSMRMQAFFGGVPLQGDIKIDMGEPMVSWVHTSLESGWYMAFVAGFVLLALGLLRDAITGKSKLALPRLPSKSASMSPRPG